jgi:gliding motility-associated-like protein
MKKQLISLLFIFQCLFSFAQGEGNHWYFGYTAGLDFTSGAPVPDLNGALNTWEGCSAVSDKNGNLLFYTDGSLVYTRNHTIMPNGSGLLGNSSSTQSAMIVKKPGTDTTYYIFTTPAASAGGFYYSEVNLNLNGGFGDIVLSTKNTNLLPLVGERVTAAKHSNGIYSWIITKVTNTDAYYAYLINCNGVQSPVITNIGLNAPGGNYGSTVASPNNKKIASTFFASSTAIEILDFDNSTGILSNPITQAQIGWPYGACFSPNSNLFYFSNISNGNVIQYNLNAGTGSSADVLASATTVGSILPTSGFGFRGGALQLGPNTKMYIAEDGQANIGVISNPNVVGNGCNFTGDALNLGGKISGLGLPAFFLNFLDTTVINYNFTCVDSSTYFSINGDSTALDSVHWDFGDIASGSNNYSDYYEPSHIYSVTGNYSVQLIRYFTCGSDTNNITVNIVPNTVVASASGASSICEGETLLLNAFGGVSYSWMGPAAFADTAQTISINNANSGLYVVTVRDANGCADTASLNVSIHTPPVAVASSNNPVTVGSSINLSTDTVSGIVWTGPNSFTSVQQNPTITNAQMTDSGIYQVIKTNSFGCKDTAEVLVTVYQPEIPDNLIDDDIDGLIDCADPDLATLNQCYICGYDSIAWKTVIPESGFNKGIAVKYTGFDQHFVVPAGVTSIKVKAWGAGGGGGYTVYNDAAGAGGFTVDQLVTLSGETYVIVAGEGGWATRATNQIARATYGFGGSGNSLGSGATSETGSGGGLSGLFYAIVTQANARVIAGGGGGIADAGGVNETSGGNGNGPLSGGYLPLTGQNAIANSTGFGGGGGGYEGGISGISRFSFRGNTADAGEGGSGYKYTSGGLIKFTPELNIYPPDTSDVHYIVGAGVGNDYDMPVNAIGDVKTGGNGLVVIQWFEPIDDLTITTTKDSICKGDTLTLIASGHSNYLWSPAATLSSDTAKTIIAAPIVDITYQVISNYNNCKDTATIQIIVHQLPNLTISPDSSVCIGDSLQINASGAFSYLWFPVTGLNPSFGAALTAGPLVTTKYYVTGIDNNNCSSTDSLIIAVDSLPIASITGVAGICNGDSTTLTAAGGGTYLWNTGASSFAILTAPSSTTSYFVVVTNSNNCIDTATFNLLVHPLPVPQFSVASVCEGSSAAFSNLSTINPPDMLQSYSWDFGDGSSLNGAQDPAHVFASDGSYPVRLIVVSDFGCFDSITKSSVVQPNPTVSFSANDTAGCEPLCISFQNSSFVPNGSIVQWEWNVGDGSPGTTSQSFDHCYTNNSVYSPNSFNVTLTVTSDSGCVSTISKNNYITVYPNPDAGFTVSPQTTTITNPIISITNLSAGGNSWNWNFGDGSDTSSALSPLPCTYADTGTYIITLITSTQYSCIDTAYQTVIIEPDFLFYIPNAFSPDGDGINDTFIGKGVFIKGFEMTIFDRWGNLIYKTNDINKPWDGKANRGGEIAQAEVYVYVIEALDLKDRKHKYNGIVTLMR